MRGILEQALQSKSAAEWERLFDDAGVPAGRIFTIPEIMAHPQVESRRLIMRFKNVPGIGRDLAVTRVGFHLASGQPDLDRPPPQLGEDTATILRSLGFSPSDIDELRQQGAI